MTDYQTIIIGGGPTGLTAGIYAARGRIKSVLIEKGAHGGQVLNTDWVDNYPGFVDGISGFELSEKLEAHAARFDLERLFASVASLEIEGKIKKITLEDGRIISSNSLIISTGARPRPLGVEGEYKFKGLGVSYCATCDGPFYREQDIVVVGGGNTAIQEAIHLTKFARKVTVVHRRDKLKATEILQEKAFANGKIEFIWNSQVKKIEGDDDGVNKIIVQDKSGKEATIEATGIFVLIGVLPNNSMLPLDVLEHDSAGFIITSNEMETNVAGVFAAGDIRSKRFRQIINAAGEGATAELSAEMYLASLK